MTSARDIAAEMKLTRAGHWSVAKTYREHRPKRVKSKPMIAQANTQADQNSALILRGASDWCYAIVPVLGPMIGGGLGGMFLRAIAK